jgi:hypothetical protein
VLSLQALLPSHSGTLAECVSQLLVQLVLACHMEAVQLSGYWKAGGSGSVQPGERLAAHNHSWVAVKVRSLLSSWWMYAIQRLVQFVPCDPLFCRCELCTCACS